MVMEAMLDARLLALPAKMPGLFLVDVVEHGGGAQTLAGPQDAGGLGLLAGLAHLGRGLRVQGLQVLFLQGAESQEVLFEAGDRIAERAVPGLGGRAGFLVSVAR